MWFIQYEHVVEERATELEIEELDCFPDQATIDLYLHSHYPWRETKREICTEHGRKKPSELFTYLISNGNTPYRRHTFKFLFAVKES